MAHYVPTKKNRSDLDHQKCCSLGSGTLEPEDDRSYCTHNIQLCALQNTLLLHYVCR